MDALSGIQPTVSTMSGKINAKLVYINLDVVMILHICILSVLCIDTVVGWATGMASTCTQLSSAICKSPHLLGPSLARSDCRKIVQLNEKL